MSPVPFDLGSPFAKEVAGIDIGSAFAKAVIFFDQSILASVVVPTAGKYRSAVNDVLKKAFASADTSLDNIETILATGDGADQVPAADGIVDNKACIARGISYLIGSVRTVFDIGERSIRVFNFEPKGAGSGSRGVKSIRISPLAEMSPKELAALEPYLKGRAGMKPDFALVGGGAEDLELVRAIESLLGETPLIPEEPQTVAALGAALIAEDNLDGFVKS